MLGLKDIQSLVGLLTIVLAYLLTITPAGWFRAWVAKKMGDETAQDLGLLTWNPLEHVDFFGVLVLLLFSRPASFSGFGWGKHVPINPLNIHGKHRSLKIGFAFFSDSIAHFVMALVALTSSIFLFNSELLGSTSVSFSVMLARLMFAFFWLNVALVLVQGIINAVLLFAYFYTDNTVNMSPYVYYAMFLAPLVLLLLFGNELQILIVHAIVALQKMITG
jgi:hypothetical protein